MENCDEFIFYEDLVRRQEKPAVVIPTLPDKLQEAFSILVDSVVALQLENKGALWGSVVKETMKRKKPSFNETYYGFRSFSSLLEDAQRRGVVTMRRDQKSGSYIVEDLGPAARGDGAIVAPRPAGAPKPWSLRPTTAPHRRRLPRLPRLPPPAAPANTSAAAPAPPAPTAAPVPSSASSAASIASAPPPRLPPRERRKPKPKARKQRAPLARAVVVAAVDEVAVAMAVAPQAIASPNRISKQWPTNRRLRRSARTRIRRFRLRPRPPRRTRKWSSACRRPTPRSSWKRRPPRKSPACARRGSVIIASASPKPPSRRRHRVPSPQRTPSRPPRHPASARIRYGRPRPQPEPRAVVEPAAVAPEAAPAPPVEPSAPTMSSTPLEAEAPVKPTAALADETSAVAPPSVVASPAAPAGPKPTPPVTPVDPTKASFSLRWLRRRLASHPRVPLKDARMDAHPLRVVGRGTIFRMNRHAQNRRSSAQESPRPSLELR